MCITINAIESCTDIPDCMAAVVARTATPDDDHLGIPAELILHGWPSTKLWKELQPYWSFPDEIEIIDIIARKDRRIIALASLQDRALKQLHLNHMGIEKTRLLACESIYGINTNVNIEEAIENCPTGLDIQTT